MEPPDLRTRPGGARPSGRSPAHLRTVASWHGPLPEDDERQSMVTEASEGAQKPLGEAIQDSAVENLGVRPWDLPTIFRESAEAATDNGLAYWAVLVLSGAIATLGLALNSSAVVIGAMLVAPLLGPMIGLALALAVGDGRLAIQTAAVVCASTLAVALTGAALTAVLPFQTITLEISARARPSTIDLAIAIFSGLVGAVVTVARGSRLSAAIPGVAISVALIPPLAVAGFGLAADRNMELVWGSMLLYGANLAGIVLSGMGVFLLVGMHSHEVMSTAQDWHRTAEPHGLAGLVDRIGWVRRLGIQRSPWSRVGLVVAFVVALAIPLTDTLRQIARDARVDRAVDAAADRFEVPGSTSVLGREIVYGPTSSRVYLRVATTSWFGDEDRQDFEIAASAAAGEPVTLVLEQLPVSGGDVEEFARMLPDQIASPARGALSTRSIDLLTLMRARLESIPGAVALPSGVSLVGLELSVPLSGRILLTAAYASDEALPMPAEEMLAQQLVAQAEIPGAEVRLNHVPTHLMAIGSPPDSVPLAEIAGLLERYPQLGADIVGPSPADTVVVRGAMEALRRMGVDSDRLSAAADTAQGLSIRLRRTDD